MPLAARWWAASLCLLLAGGLVHVPAVAAAAGPEPARQPGLESQADREEPEASPDERSALVAAEESGARVEVLSARTETSQTFATPRGTLLVEEHLRPQWVRDEDGTWTDADASLVPGPGGSWSPAAATAAMTFSGGGDGPFATIAVDDASVGLRWPGALPEPVVEGGTATYRDVAPGVDLQVIADVDGFTHLVVIRSPKAWEDLATEEFTLETDLAGASLRVTDTGAVEAVTGAGEVVLTGPSPMMWDSRDQSGPGAGAAPGGAALDATADAPKPDEPEPDFGASADVQPMTAPVTAEVTSGGLTLVPDAEMLTDPETVFPVYIDPTWIKVTGKRNKWSLLRKSFPHSSFYNPAVGSTSSSDSTKGTVRAGYVVEDRAYTDRSLFNMSTSAVKYRRINRAVFSLTQGWSFYNCGHSSPPTVRLRSVGSFGSSTTWGNQPSWGSTLATSKKIRKYGHSCGPQRVEYNITSHVRSAAADGRSSVDLGLRAASETEGNWTRFRTDAKLSIEYNTAPNSPSRLRVLGKGCATGSSRPYVTVDRPTFSARNSDDDSGQQSMSTRFYWWRSGQSRNSSDYVTGSSANPGTANSASVPASKALDDRVVYKYQARTSDGIDVTWSSVCEFRAWLNPPEPPTDVVSTAYPEYDPVVPGTGSGGVGFPGSFTISPPASGVSDVVGYAYTLDTGIAAAAAPVVAKGAGGSASVTIHPERDGLNVLRVWSKDVAGLFSPVVEYWFLVRSGEGPAARWTFDNPQDLGEDSTGHGNGLTLENGATTVAGRASVGTALSLDGTDDRAVTAGSLQQPHPDTGSPVVVRTDSTFTVAAWVQADTLGSPVRIAVAADASRVSPFMLGYDGTTGKWRFAMASSDTDSPPLAMVRSSADAVAGRWTHLAGTYDAASGVIRLYVNGVLQSATATLSGGYHTSGPVVVGRRTWNGAPGSHFDGRIDDVRVYSFIPPANVFEEMARPLPPVISFPGGDTVEVGGTLQVRFDASGDTNVTGFRYSAGGTALDQTVALATAGGAATVAIPVTALGALRVVGVSVDQAGRWSDRAESTARVVGELEVSGVVYDQFTFEPVVGATVRLDPAGLSAETGVDGSFSFSGFAPGTYTLAANSGGLCGMAAASAVDVFEPMMVSLYLVPAQDDFGYTCQEAFEVPFTPVAGDALPLSGDDAVAQVSLPIEFPFYGEGRHAVWVDTNGVVSFEDPDGSHADNESGIPSPARPDALIAAHWADLVVDGQASIHTEVAGAAPSRTFTIEWRDVHLKGDTSARLSVQVILGEDGSVVLHYDGLDTVAAQGQAAVVGLESPGGQVGLQYAYRQSVLSSGLQIVFHYPEFPNPIFTGTLSGTVVDAATGQPAAGVEVSLDPVEAAVTTSPDGEFSFPDLEWGSYIVEAQTRSHCGTGGQAYVDLDAPAEIQLDLHPTTDEYGYSCQAGPRSMLSTSSTLPLTGDDSNADVALPFPFVLYGETYSLVWVNTNGLLIFAPQGFPWYDPFPIPSVHYSPSAAIYAFWSDWEVDASASVRTATTGMAPSRRFVVEWRDVVHRQDSSVRATFQVVLHETTNQIAVAWSDIGSHPLERGSDGVVGIENVDGTIALTYQEFDQAVSSGQGVLFTPGDPGLHEVAGQVTCEGAPVAGADVRVGQQTTVTDAQGGFGFAGVAPGPQGLVVNASTGDCEGSVAMPVAAVRGEPEWVDVAMNPVADAVGYTVTRPGTSMLAANTVVSLPGTDGGDDELVSLTPPFPVRLYGQTYSQAWVDTNGYVMFANRGFSDPIPFPIPSADWSPDAAVYPFWNDWVVDSLASIRTGTHGSAPNRRWVVEWRNVHPYNMWHRVNFQVVFDETTGVITFSYSGIAPTFVERGGAGLSGVENSASAAGIQYSYLAPVIFTGRGLILTPVNP